MIIIFLGGKNKNMVNEMKYFKLIFVITIASILAFFVTGCAKHEKPVVVKPNIMLPPAPAKSKKDPVKIKNKKMKHKQPKKHDGPAKKPKK
jgi:hypothetical protein